MIHAANTEEICFSPELSNATPGEAAAGREGNWFGEQVIRLESAKPAAGAQSKAAQRIEVSLRYMMENLNQPMKVPALSAMVGLSESSFFALFKSATGLTPIDFLIRTRMQRAGELLAETTLQIKQIAAMLGYDDQFYFSRLFKSVHGVAPREYRTRLQPVANAGGGAAAEPVSAPAALATVRAARISAAYPFASMSNAEGRSQTQTKTVSITDDKPKNQNPNENKYRPNRSQ